MLSDPLDCKKDTLDEMTKVFSNVLLKRTEMLGQYVCLTQPLVM